MKNIYHFLLLITLLIGCNKIGVNEDLYTDTFFNMMPNSEKELFITANFSECGEWGGSREEMIIYKAENRECYLDYIKYDADCSDIENVRSEIYKKNIKLGSYEKKAIVEYISILAGEKSREVYESNAMNFFSVVNKDSTLLIKVYSEANDLRTIELYNRLQSRLGLKETLSEIAK